VAGHGPRPDGGHDGRPAEVRGPRPTAEDRYVVSESLHRPDALYVAVVHTGNGIRVVAGADSRHELVLLLADYVRQRVGETLSGDEARSVRGLLVRGEFESAVEVYFGLLGRRRGEEWLVTVVLASDDQPDVEVALGAVARPTSSMARLDSLSREPFSFTGSVSDLELVS
jgi:hypothetical protein